MTNKKDELSFEEKIKREIDINLDVNEEIGEKNILYFNIILSKKGDDIIPTFTLMKKDDSQVVEKLTNKTSETIENLALELVEFVNGNIDENTDTVSM